MKLLVLSCAEQELIEAVSYYNDQCPGLGYEMALEVQRAFERIENFPDAWPQFSESSRRCLVDRFPYGVLYQMREDCILIGAIMHLKRDPVHWRDNDESLFKDSSPEKK